MRSGQFDSAWKISADLLARKKDSSEQQLPRHLKSVWSGSGLRGRRILIRCYHGLGDTIQFIRYAPLVKKIATSVSVLAQPELISILESVAGIDRLIPLTESDPQIEFDVDVEVMELPFIFRTTLSTIPAQIPYLHVTPLPIARREKSAVGLVWKAGDWDPRRSIPLHSLKPLKKLHEDIEYYNLQCSPEESARGEKFGRPACHPTIVETARFMRSLDLIISVDSMPVHLAGALGLPTWNLLHADADWRWMKKRRDTPWYPTMRLFRQSQPDDWESVVAEVVAELGRMGPDLSSRFPARRCG